MGFKDARLSCTIHLRDYFRAFCSLGRLLMITPMLPSSMHISRFAPRAHFQLPSHLPRSYFLGHHKAGLDRIKRMVSHIDLVLECRDYRVPFTGRNPLLVKELGLANDSGGRMKRIVVYTKCDLGVGDGPAELESAKRRNDLLTQNASPSPVFFSTASTVSYASPAHSSQQQRAADSSTLRLLSLIRKFSRENFSLTGHRVLVAGLPNVGKSTLINALRKAGIPRTQRAKKKVAETGADPGVTRAVSSMIKILEADTIAANNSTLSPVDASCGKDSSSVSNAKAEPVYILDTPGIFIPHVPDPLSMLKLALCGSVKDSLLPPTTVADYLLFQINKRGFSQVYRQYAEPTNDIGLLLTGIARNIGRLGKGGAIDLEGSAIWFIKRWRQGRMGKFVLDDVIEDERREADISGSRDVAAENSVSWSQALKMDRESRRKQNRASARSSTSS